MSLLLEHNTFDDAHMELTESSDSDKNGLRKLIMKGIFLQADTQNRNRRIYCSTNFF